MEKLKIFISWSGERSLSVAEAHREWLQNVFQMVEPWISAADIDKGAKWGQAISGELGKSDFGLICLTPENLTSPWLLFEAGALAKKEQSRVCTYLFELKHENVKDPLSQFQHTLANEADTKKLVATINRSLPAAAALTPERLGNAFEMWWPRLRDQLAGIPKPSGPAAPERTDGDKISEILTRIRALEKVIVSRGISTASDAATVSMMLVRRGLSVALDKKGNDAYELPPYLDDFAEIMADIPKLKGLIVKAQEEGRDADLEKIRGSVETMLALLDGA